MRRLMYSNVLFSILALALVLVACASPGGRLPNDSAPGDPPMSEATGEVLTFAYHEVGGVDSNSLSLDIYPMTGSRAPVVLFFHGGTLTAGVGGDKTAASGGAMPEYFGAKGMLFASTNFRQLGEVDTVDDVSDSPVADGARAIAWIQDNIADYGGDPDNILLLGYSAGSYISGMLAGDPSYLATQGAEYSAIKGTVLGDTIFYDVPRAIATAEEFGFPSAARSLPNIFGIDIDRQREASVITHIAPMANLPPFLIMYVHEKDGLTHTLSQDQSELLANVVETAGGEAILFEGEGHSHNTLLRAIGVAGEAVTETFDSFLATTVLEGGP